MDTPGLRPLTDVSPGAWIGPRLSPAFGRVGRTIPTGFAAYARILHPIGEPAERLRWSDVAAATGRQVHATVQWDRLAGVVEWREGIVTHRTIEWTDGEPGVGNLDPLALRALIEVLRPHTPAGPEWLVGLWEGYGWIDAEFSPEVVARPRLRHPGRAYLLLSGPPEAIPTLGHWPTATWFIPQSPNLMWPADQSWCVASEIDFASTLVGGSAAVIADVLACPALEAWAIEVDADVSIDGDHVN